MPQVNDIQAIRNYAGQYAPTIIGSVVNGLDIANDVTVVRNLTVPRNLPKYKGNKGLRPNNTSIEEPKGQHGTMSVRKLVPHTAMKIFKVIPEELRDTYLSEQLSPNAKEYPQGFAQYFWQEQVKVVQSEINDNSFDSFDSEDILAFNAGTAYTVGQRFLYKDDFYEVVTATTAGQTPETHAVKFEEVNNSSIAKGFGTIIAEEYSTLPSSNKIATGLITDTNAYDKIVGFYRGIPVAQRKLGGVVYTSFDTYDSYMIHVQNKFTNGTSYLDVEGELAGYIYGSGRQWKIKPCTWMGASKRIIGTRKENLYMGTNLTSDFSSLGKVVETLHGYKAIMKMILSYEIADLESLFVNDQV
ncbi:hypothetical protein [Spirosoma fluminis]